MKKNGDVISGKDIAHKAKVSRVKKPKKPIASKASKTKENDDLIETFDDDDLNFELGLYREVYDSMREW